MRLLIDKFRSLGIGWNERPLDDRDAEMLCRRLNITLDERPLTVNGFYYRLLERDFIAVDSRLHGPQRLAVMFHELAHAIFHAPAAGASAEFHHVGRPTRQEHEADVFAICGLIPKSSVATRTAAELREDGFPEEMIAARIDVYDRYGI